MPEYTDLIDLEKHLMEQETTRKINEEARIENEKRRNSSYEEAITQAVLESSIKYHDPIEWDVDTNYKRGYIVSKDGRSYLSKKDVPAGIPVTNEDYWQLVNDGNAELKKETDERKAGDAKLDLSIQAEATRAKAAEEAEQTRAEAAENALTTYIQNKGKYLVTFGDSWGNGDGEWPSIIASRLGLTLKNFCISGAAFPFADEIVNAKADADITDYTIAFAIVLGGINNAASAVQQNGSKWEQFAINFHEAYPKTRLYMFPMNLPGRQYVEPTIPNAYENAWNSMVNVYNYLSGKNLGNTVVVQNAWLLFNNDTGLWNADTLHPNASGERVLASNMINAMSGQFSTVQLDSLIDVFANVEIIQTPYLDDEGLHMPIIKITKTSDITMPTAWFRSYYFKQPMLDCTLYAHEATGQFKEIKVCKVPTVSTSANQVGYGGSNINDYYATLQEGEYVTTLPLTIPIIKR